MKQLAHHVHARAFLCSALVCLLQLFSSARAQQGCCLPLPPTPANEADAFIRITYGSPVGTGIAPFNSFLELDILPGGGGSPTPPIINTRYAAWCFDVETVLDPGPSGTSYGGRLYSTCGPNQAFFDAFNAELPNRPNVRVGPVIWKQINYLINRRQLACNGAAPTMWEVQNAIWTLMGQRTLIAAPYPGVRQPVVDCLVNTAVANAPSWIPGCNDKVAVIYNIDVNWDDMKPDVQLIFLEVPCNSCASIGDLVFNDVNGNGLREGGEVGVDGIKVELFTSGGTLAGTTTTAGGGLYGFNVPPGDYYVMFSGLPAGFVFSPSTPSGASDPIDSDANPVTGKTDVTTLTIGENDPTWDAGITQPQNASLGDKVFNDLDADGVQDPGEAGVGGVRVDLFTAAGAPVGSTVTLGDGTYGFIVPAGEYYVMFSNLPAGFVFSPSTPGPASDPNDSDANPATGKTNPTTLVSGENDPTWDAGIYQPARIGDFVFNDVNANGIQEPGEPGVDGVKVELFTSSNVSVGTTTTASGGLYGFNVPPGDYYAVFSNLPLGFVFSPSTPGNASDPNDSDANPANGRTDVTTLVAGENDPTWDAGINRVIFLGDTVWRDNNGNGVQDPLEPGVPGVTVQLLNCAGNVAQTAVTDGLGKYSFRVPVNSQWEFRFLNPGGFTFSPTGVGNPATDSNPDSTGFFACATYTSNNITIDAGLVPIPTTASIGDFVFNDLNRNGIQDAGEPGVDGVKVDLFKSDNTPAGSTTTAGGGLYGFTTAPGDYYVVFSNLPAGFVFSPSTPGNASDPNDSDANPTTGRTDVTTLTPGENDPTWDAGINRPIVLNATIGDLVFNDFNRNGIQDAGEPGVDGVKVELFKSDNTSAGTTTTAGGGQYGFNTPPGDYYVVFSGLPAGFVFSPSTPSNASDPSDSDADPTTGRTATTTLDPGENDPTWDAGINRPPVLNASIGDFVFNDFNRNGIQDGGEPGVDGVKVELFRADNTSAGTTTTAGGGQYGFNTPPGDYYVVFSGLPAGFVFSPSTPSTNSDPNDSDADPTTGRTATTTLDPGENDPTWDAGINRPPVLTASIGDFVFNDFNRNGIQDGGEPGVDGVKVELFRADNTSAGTTTTAGGGQYGFNTPPGDYYVVFSGLPAGFVFSPSTPSTDSDPSDSDADPTTGRTATTTLTPGENDLSWDAGINRPPVLNASIGDFVFNDFNRNGIQDGGEPGVDGVKVELFRADNTSAGTTTTAGGGQYGFNTPPGDYYVVFSGLPAGFVFSPSTPSTDSDPSDSDADPTTGRTATTTLTPGENDLSWDAGINRPPVLNASIGDLVFNDFNRDGIQDGGEPGVDGVKVELFRADNTSAGTTTTAGGGKYGFTTPPGDYYVVFSGLPDGFVFSPSTPSTDSDPDDSDADPTTGRTATTTLIPGENDPTWDAGINRPPVLNASIGDLVFNDTNANGLQDVGETGVGGVTVQLFTSGGTLAGTTTTSTTGLYGFSVQPGDYFVVFSGLPAGAVFSPSTPGNASDPNDSDANPANGQTDVTTLVAGENDPTWDAGIYTPVANCVECYGVFDGNTPLFGSSGNLRIFGSTISGLSAKVSAFSRNKTTKAWRPAYVGVYAGGLGVTDETEGQGLNGTSHTDNVGEDNFLLIEFSQPVIIRDLYLGHVLTDSDLTAWVGNFSDPYNNHIELNESVLASFGAPEDNTTTLPGARTATLNAGNRLGNAFLVAAQVSDASPNDCFNLRRITFCKPTTACTSVVSGTIYNDCNADGIVTGDAGLSGITVSLRSGTSTLQSVVTDGTGNYSFSGVTPGNYSVVVTPSAHYKVTYPANCNGIRSGSVVGCQNVSGLNFGYAGTAPSVFLTKTCPATATVGETVTFTYTVKNTGNTCLYGGMTVYDPLFGGQIWHKTPVEPGEEFTFTKTYVVRSSDPGNCVCPATAYGHPPGLPVVSHSATCSFTVGGGTGGGVCTGIVSTGHNGYCRLTWNPLSGCTYSVRRSSTANGTYVDVKSGLTSPSYDDVNVVNGTMYYYKIHAVFNGTVGPASSTVHAAPCFVPSPWASKDIGNGIVSGCASATASGFSLIGSGDMWNSADGFHYMYQLANGDCSVVVRCNSIENTHEWAKAGVQIRESLNADSKMAGFYLTPVNGVTFQKRNSTGKPTTATDFTTLTGPCWLKLVRKGDRFTYYRSTNGSSWSELGDTSVSMGSRCYIGLGVSSHNNGTLSTATFSNLTATP